MRISQNISAGSRAAFLALLSVLLLAVGPPPAAAQAKTYVALGDSVAYGFMNLTSTPLGTAGFPGYVQPYAAFLGTNVTPVNLGIVGETTTSLLNNSGENDDLNSHYSETTSQYDLLSTYLSSNASNITIQVGANDLLALAQTTAFQQAVQKAALTGDAADEQRLLNGTLAIVASNYDTLLTRVSALAPGARVQVLGYYSPYSGLPATDPASGYLHGISDPLTLSLNTVLKGESAKFGAQYVDLYTPFHGNEAALLLNGELLNTPFGLLPNDHPTAAGYAVIARQLAAAPVPEASPAVSFGLLLALGLGGMIVAARRKKARA